MHRLLILISFFLTPFIYAQDSLLVKKNTPTIVTSDSIVDGIKFSNKQIAPETENDSLQGYKDHELAAKYDEKWLEELYSNTLFDTIYRDVTNLKYEAVYLLFFVAPLSQYLDSS